MLGNANTIINFLLNVEKDKIFKIEEYKKKRTLTQNSYYWSLVNQLAVLLKIPPQELHTNLIKRYTVSELITVKAEIDVSRYFKYYTELRNAKINGKDFKVYKVYVGSSKMARKEFSLLLDGIIEECKQQEIPTLTKQEIEKLKYIENEV